jgi:DNA polymerase
MATQIYGREITKADVEQRQIGKNTVLGCGFQMGWRKFQERYCPHQPDEFAQGVIKTYRREWAPMVPELWKGLEYAALTCVQSGMVQEAYGVVFQVRDRWLTARLPSGNVLWYFDPHLVQKLMPWTDNFGDDVYRTAWQFTSWSGETKHHELVDAYGGFITENVVQAMARQLMVEAMFRCEKEGFPIVLTVHDEILTEPRHGDLKALEQIMTYRPAWAEAIKVPIQIEKWEGNRYKK